MFSRRASAGAKMKPRASRPMITVDLSGQRCFSKTSSCCQIIVRDRTSRLNVSGFSKMGRQSKNRMPGFGKSESENT
jgi:hypothetical protein